MNIRGNPTAVTRYTDPVTPAGPLTTTSVYDYLGNLRSVTDPGGHTTNFSYDDNYSDHVNRSTFADLTKTTKPKPFDSQTIGISYYYYTGEEASVTDENSRVASFTYADPLNRLTQINYPDSGNTTFIYVNPNQTDVQKSMTSSTTAYSATLLDGLGRVSRVASQNGESSPWDQQDFCYDSNGRLDFQSYPYQGSGWSTAKVCSGAGDTFAYDALGRTTSVTHSDGNSVVTTFSGRAVQVQDEGNGSTRVSRITQADGLVRLIAVCEIYIGSALQGSGGTPANCGLDIQGSGFLTSYGYDTLGNLTSVTQGALASRTYGYDGLSQMTSETTPEAGTATYTYNADGLLATRTQPAANQTSGSVTWTTTYVYDALHRLSTRTYSSSDPVNNPVNTPSASFNYDEASVWNTTLSNPIGRLTSESLGGALPAKQIFSYDPMGRPNLNAQCTPHPCNASPFTPYTLSYQLDFLGNVTQASNGFGVTLTNSHNVASRLAKLTSSLSDATHPSTLLSKLSYSPTVITGTLGNGVVETNAVS